MLFPPTDSLISSLSPRSVAEVAQLCQQHYSYLGWIHWAGRPGSALITHFHFLFLDVPATCCGRTLMTGYNTAAPVRNRRERLGYYYRFTDKGGVDWEERCGYLKSSQHKNTLSEECRFTDSHKRYQGDRTRRQRILHTVQW